MTQLIMLEINTTKPASLFFKRCNLLLDDTKEAINNPENGQVITLHLHTRTRIRMHEHTYSFKQPSLTHTQIHIHTETCQMRGFL